MFYGYFLTIKEDEVGLVHHSVKNYFLRKTPNSNDELEFRIKEEKGNLVVARGCLAYLQNGALADGKASLDERMQRVEDATYRITIYSRGPPNSFSLLHLASDLRPIRLVKDLRVKREGWATPVLKWHNRVNQRNSEGQMPLHLAATEDRLTVILLEQQANINVKNNYKSTALHLASENGHETIVWMLLQQGANLNAQGRSGKTALHLAARRGHETIVRMLLKLGANTNVKDDQGGIALHMVAEYGRESVVRMLLEQGANVGKKGNEGVIALDLVIEWVCKEVLLLFESWIAPH